VKQGYVALALALTLGGGALIGATNASAFALIIAPSAPPAVIVETASPAPGPEWSWIAGHWDWRGRWVWEHGYWTKRPHPGAVWVGGAWVIRGGGWVWVEGRWR
jgi:hypothetical protein